MTREEALLKLLMLEPERHDNLRRITGWPPPEMDAVLHRLERSGYIGHVKTICHSKDYRVYFVKPEGPPRPSRGAAARAVANSRRAAAT